MWDFLTGNDWTQTTWMRWGFGLLIFVVGYVGSKILGELQAIRAALQEINGKTQKRFMDSDR